MAHSQARIWVERIHAGILPISLRRARLDHAGKSAWGYGEALSADLARKKAVSEAWERMALLLESAKSGGGLSSNGFAAHENSESALVSAVHELKERRLLQVAWAEQKGWAEYELRCLVSKTLSYCLQLQGWRSRFFLLTEIHGERVLTGLLECPRRGVLFDSVYGSETGDEAKLCLSLLRAALLVKDASGFRELPKRGAPADHYQFYRNPKNREAFRFLDKLPRLSFVEAFSEERKIESKLVLESGTGLYVARASHSGWEKFLWGSQSIRGRNPWPHPLA